VYRCKTNFCTLYNEKVCCNFRPRQENCVFKCGKFFQICNKSIEDKNLKFEAKKIPRIWSVHKHGKKLRGTYKTAELQLANKDNNPTVNNLLIDLHKGINYYKEKAERLEADLKQAEADMKEVLLGEDICNFCKNKISNEVCEGQDCDCSQCTVDCACKLCSFDSEATCNFKWRGRT